MADRALGHGSGDHAPEGAPGGAASDGGLQAEAWGPARTEAAQQILGHHGLPMTAAGRAAAADPAVFDLPPGERAAAIRQATGASTSPFGEWPNGLYVTDPSRPFEPSQREGTAKPSPGSGDAATGGADLLGAPSGDGTGAAARVLDQRDVAPAAGTISAAADAAAVPDSLLSEAERVERVAPFAAHESLLTEAERVERVDPFEL